LVFHVADIRKAAIEVNPAFLDISKVDPRPENLVSEVPL
jgi:hypothetical protein